MVQHIPPRVVREDRRDRLATRSCRERIHWQCHPVRHCDDRVVTEAPQPASTSGTPAATEFVGSAACQSCHQDIYARWKKRRWPTSIQDPRTHPEAVLGDFSTPNPLVTFRPEDVAFVYGSQWKQRYFTKIGDDYFVQPAQWDVRNKVWRQYYVRARHGLVDARSTRLSRPSGRPVRSATAAIR